MASNLLIVESPSKAKTIEKYLGKGKKVGDCTPTNAPQLELILMELRELV